MSLDEKKWLSQQEKHPEVLKCIAQSKTMNDALPSYKYLFSLKNSIPKELYAYYFRKLLQMNTANVPVALRLKMFEGVIWDDIMFQDELDAISEFNDFITVYRGTDQNEETPGLSWTIDKRVAEDTFYRGRMFKAVIPKDSILLYLAHQEAEGEIIAKVTAGYEIVK